MSSPPASHVEVAQERREVAGAVQHAHDLDLATDEPLKPGATETLMARSPLSYSRL